MNKVLQLFSIRLTILLSLVLSGSPWTLQARDVLAQSVAAPRTSTKLPDTSSISKAKILIEKNDLMTAIRYLTEALEQSPKPVDAFLLRGEAFDKMGFPMKALQDLNRYIQLRPNDPEGYIRMADTNNFNLDHKAAIEYYNKALRLAPNSRSALLGRGMAFAALECYDLAMQDYLSVLSRYSTDHEAWANLGMVYSLAGKKEKALESFNKALELESDPAWRVKINHMLEQLTVGANSEKQKSMGPTRFPTNKTPGLW